MPGWEIGRLYVKTFWTILSSASIWPQVGSSATGVAALFLKMLKNATMGRAWEAFKLLNIISSSSQCCECFPQYLDEEGDGKRQ